MTVTPPPRARLGDLIVRARRERGWSQSRLARAADISRNTLANVENGGPRDTEDYVYGRIEAALGWQTGSAADVLAGGEPRPATAVDDIAQLRAIVDDHNRPDFLRERAQRLLDDIEFVLAADRDQRKTG